MYYKRNQGLFISSIDDTELTEKSISYMHFEFQKQSKSISLDWFDATIELDKIHDWLEKSDEGQYSH